MYIYIYRLPLPPLQSTLYLPTHSNHSKSAPRSCPGSLLPDACAALTRGDPQGSMTPNHSKVEFRRITAWTIRDSAADFSLFHAGFQEVSSTIPIRQSSCGIVLPYSMQDPAAFQAYPLCVVRRLRAPLADFSLFQRDSSAFTMQILWESNAFLHLKTLPGTF